MEESKDWGLDSESTADPSVSMIAEDVPTLTITTILGVTVVILIAIVVVFVLGILIDWRQQRMLDRKIGQIKRKKSQRRVNSQRGDIISIADHMEDTGISPPPADILRGTP